MIQNTLAIAVVALAVTAVMAQSDPLSQRKTLIKGNLEGAQNVTKMVRGENPFDPAKVNAAFVQWTETAQKLPTLFPDSNAGTGNTRLAEKTGKARPTLRQRSQHLQRR